MEKDLTTTERIDNQIALITTRAGSLSEVGKLRIFDENKLAKIADNMLEVNRSIKAFGRKNSQTTNKLMTLTMVSGTSPYRILRQCLAEIEKKRGAIKESRFRLMREKLDLEKFKCELTDLEEDYEQESDPKKARDLDYEILHKRIDIEEKASSVEDSILYIEGALKDIASFQSAYSQICKNKNIPENWDEKNFEEAEIDHHVRMAFLLSFRDTKVSGRIGMGTLEYLHQFGIHPDQVKIEVAILQKQIEDKMTVDLQGRKCLNTNAYIDYEEDLEKWLDQMTEKYRDKYKKVLKRIGIGDLHEDWYMFIE